MTNSLFDRFSSTDIASVQRKQRKQKQGRILRIEELENRELLSVSPWNAVIPMPSSSSMTQWEDSTDADTQVVVSSASASVMSAASVPISAVTGLTVTDRTHQSITVEWNEVSDAAGYELRYSVHDPWSSRREWTVVSDITDVTFTINGLQSRTNYEIQVCAVAEGTFSNWRYVTAHTTYFVPTPTDLSVSVGEMSNHIFDRSAVLTWNAGEGSTALNSIAYVVECREYGTDVWSSRFVGIALATTWTSLMPGSTYEFRVRAESAGISSEWSDSVWVTVPATTAPSTTVTQSWGGSVAVVGSTLEIQGTDYSDWIEIQQTSTSIIVHSFCDQRIDRTGIWSFDTEGISQISFWGYGGNDVFIGAYEGVSTTIAMRLDGGGGDNWLVGGAGNDWIYGGWLGNSHLDTGVSGDSVVVGGRGANVFYNTSAGSDMFIGVTDTWADGHSLGLTDGRLVMRMSGGTGSYGYVFDDWTEAEVLGIAKYVQQTYDILGTYRFFTGFGFPDRQASVSLSAYISRVGSMSGYADIASGSLMAFWGMPSYSTFVHEVAHFWHNQNRNPIWSDFHSISWDGSEQHDEDFARGYGMTNSMEDWTTTMSQVVTGNNPYRSFASSAKWHQKVDMVHQFFAYLNPSYIRQSDTSDVLDAPSAVRVLDKTFDSITVEWDEISGTTEYEVWLQRGDNLVSMVVTNTLITVTGLQEDTGYWIYVRAMVGEKSSDWSPLVYATTLVAPVEEPPVEEPTDEPSVEKPPIDEPTDEPIEEEPIDIPVAPSAPTDMRIDESAPYSVVLQWTQSDEVSSYVLEYR